MESTQAVKKYKETLAYDERGNPVVLRTSLSIAAGSEPALQSSQFIEGKANTSGKTWGSGSMRLFGGVNQFKAQLQKKAS